MSELIVAGGTGQEVALAVIRLAYLCGVNPPRIWVFDSDVGATSDSGRSRAQSLQDLQQQLRACGVWGDDKLNFLNPAELLNRTSSVHRIDDVFGRFGQLDPQDDRLLDLLLTDRQRQTTISDGFHGQPALGSLAVAAAFEEGTYGRFLETLRQQADSQGGLRVVLAGSIAGGTGTSVIPLVAREVRQIGAGGATARVEMLGVVQLPWFDLQRLPSDPSSQPPDVDVAMFDRNASCLLKGYLEQTFTQEIDSVVLLGLPRTVQRASYGGHRQPETHHYVCLVAGMVAMNLLTQASTQALLGPAWQGFHAPSLGTDRQGFEGPPLGPAVFLPPAKRLSVGALLKQALSLVAFSEALLDETSSLAPSIAHHRTVYQVLSGLRTAVEREALRTGVERLHRVHEGLLEWLIRSLKSEVGSSRADTLRAFIPETNWSELTEVGAGRFLKGSNAWLSWPALGRRVISGCGPFREVGAAMSGSSAAWGLVEQARRNLLSAA